MKLTILYIIIFILSSTYTFSQTDEFSEFEEKTEFVESNTDDEFSENLDEFSNDEFSEFNETSNAVEQEPESKTNWIRFYWAISILAFTILAGILVRFEKTRKLKPIFLLAAVAILGFYRGGPGIISSFQNTFLFFIGVTDVWPAIVLFLGLIPITYFFGKVFCGWTCYLGAIQEFLYIGKFKILQSAKAQNIMRIVRYVVFVLLIAQLTYTQGIEWSKIGPFKVIFNLFSPNITGYVLLVILLLSSLFIHRPFCRMICPAGLAFGWVTKLPGASILGITDTCLGCKTCSTSCEINAITRDGKTSKLDNQECIMCGDCMSDCKIKSIHPFRKGKNHTSKITLMGIKKMKL